MKRFNKKINQHRINLNKFKKKFVLNLNKFWTRSFNLKANKFKSNINQQGVNVAHESSDEEDDGQEEKQVSNSEVAECVKKCLSWMERQQCLPF